MAVEAVHELPASTTPIVAQPTSSPEEKVAV